MNVSQLIDRESSRIRFYLYNRKKVYLDRENE